MLSTDTLLQIFLNASVIVPDDDDGVFLGTMQMQDCEIAFDAVVSAHCDYIDNLLASLPLSDYEYMSLLLVRGFTFNEFAALFDKSITPVQFQRHKIFSVLLISNNEDRKLFTHLTHTRDAYNSCLSSFFKTHNPYMYGILYETENEG